MVFDPSLHHRRSIRLKGYDYRQPGAYFVTLVSYQRSCLFGQIDSGQLRPSAIGKVVIHCWRNIPNHFPFARLDEYILMPNHFHAILILGEPSTGEASAKDSIGNRLKDKQLPARVVGLPIADASPLPNGTIPKSLGAIIQNFKSISTRRANRLSDSRGIPLWQRNYYEHIIRNEQELFAIRNYILENPLKWETDSERPAFSPSHSQKAVL